MPCGQCIHDHVIGNCDMCSFAVDVNLLDSTLQKYSVCVCMNCIRFDVQLVDGWGRWIGRITDDALANTP